MQINCYLNCITSFSSLAASIASPTKLTCGTLALGAGCVAHIISYPLLQSVPLLAFSVGPAAALTTYIGVSYLIAYLFPSNPEEPPQTQAQKEVQAQTPSLEIVPTNRFFDSLPDELLIPILQFAHLSGQACHLGRVCRRFYHISNDRSVLPMRCAGAALFLQARLNLEAQEICATAQKFAWKSPPKNKRVLPLSTEEAHLQIKTFTSHFPSKSGAKAGLELAKHISTKGITDTEAYFKEQLIAIKALAKEPSPEATKALERITRYELICRKATSLILTDIYPLIITTQQTSHFFILVNRLDENSNNEPILLLVALLKLHKALCLHHQPSEIETIIQKLVNRLAPQPTDEQLAWLTTTPLKDAFHKLYTNHTKAFEQLINSIPEAAASEILFSVAQHIFETTRNYQAVTSLLQSEAAHNLTSYHLCRLHAELSLYQTTGAWIAPKST